ncbi:E3 ubiquitin-protein ligase Hakai-like [Mobula birostris]|uniref:E3 ubiquitin-protein ligase Hakai-like n=1 Tax=Mobula birostris TaxID=1983395 RepID=UPI003B28912E
MEEGDKDLQATDSSGCLGGVDVRRRIPIKLISKQSNRNRISTRSQRNMNRNSSKSVPTDEEGFDYNEDEIYECKSGEVFGNQRRFSLQFFWDFKVNLLGEKDDTPVHFCDKCGLPIKIYGRMIPCKHVFCFNCASLQERKGDRICPGCNDPVQRIEQCLRGSLFMCSIVQGCKRTYLSQRDLQAHINHRHMRTNKAIIRPQPEQLHTAMTPAAEMTERFLMPQDKHHLPHLPPKQHTIMMPPPPLQHVSHDHYSQTHEDIRPPPSEMALAPPPRSVNQETFRISTVTTRKHSNLITVPIQDDSSSSGSREPPPATPHHHPEYQNSPVVPHPHHMLPPQQHYAPPPPPPPPISHPMQHPAQTAGNPHMVYNQAPPPPLSAAPPPINPPPGHILAQMPPYMNHPPHGPPPPQHTGPPVNTPPPHHYSASSMPQYTEDQGTLSPPFSQPGGHSPGIGVWPAPRGPPPPRIQVPPPQAPLPAPHHPDQARYRPYYQ